MRLLTVIVLLLTAVVSSGIYQLKYDVAEQEQTLTRLNRTLAAEREAIRVLEAEWSYLNRPDRLQDLAGRHLELLPTAVYGVETVREIPLRRAAAPVEAAAVIETLSPAPTSIADLLLTLPPLPPAKPPRYSTRHRAQTVLASSPGLP